MKKTICRALLCLLLAACLLPLTARTAHADKIYDEIVNYQVDVTPNTEDGSLTIQVTLDWKPLEDLPATNSQQGGAKIGIPNGSIRDMKALSDNIADIQNDIYYLLDKGSYVVDEIGSGTDNKSNGYDFDFVNDIDRLALTVGGEVLDKTELIDPSFNDPYITSAYGFGFNDAANADESAYDFVLKYYAKGQDGASDECFVWEINVPVSNFAPVQLTYTVKLTNPQTAEGTYGQYDADGSENYSGLYTNNSATLYPVDSNSRPGQPENFRRPTVSYTIQTSRPDPGRPSHRPDRDDEPESLNTEDHVAYIIGYTDGTVRPEGDIARSEVATIFFRLLTDEAREAYWSQTNPYSDVASGDWYNNAISTLTSTSCSASTLAASSSL